LEKQGIVIQLAPEARSFLAQTGYDPAFGARPVKRILQKLVVNPLANQILQGKFKKGDQILVVMKEKNLDFKIKST
jgi:ATP-dependent Clp protease ATP-binding subunit ClpA